MQFVLLLRYRVSVIWAGILCHVCFSFSKWKMHCVTSNFRQSNSCTILERSERCFATSVLTSMLLVLWTLIFACRWSEDLLRCRAYLYKEWSMFKITLDNKELVNKSSTVNYCTTSFRFESTFAYNFTPNTVEVFKIKKT